MRLHVFLASSLFGVMWASGQDQSRVYLRTDIGPAFQPDFRVDIPSTPAFEVSARTGIRFDVASGYSFSESWAVELESGVVWTQLYTRGKHNFYQMPFMANLVWSCPGKRLRPFLGAGGGGVGIIAVPAVSAYSTDTALTYGGQAMTGLTYRLSNQAECGFGYRLLATAPTSLSDARFGAILTHSISLSLVFCF